MTWVDCSPHGRSAHRTRLMMVPETEKIDFRPIEIPRVRRSAFGLCEDRRRHCWRLAECAWAWQIRLSSCHAVAGRDPPLGLVEIDKGDVDIVVVEYGALESANNTTVRCQVEALIGTVGGARGRHFEGSGAAGGGSGQGGSGAGGSGGSPGRRRRWWLRPGGRRAARPRKKPASSSSSKSAGASAGGSTSKVEWRVQ